MRASGFPRGYPEGEEYAAAAPAKKQASPAMAGEACLCPVLGAAIRLTAVSVLIEGSLERAFRGKNRNNKHHNL